MSSRSSRTHGAEVPIVHASAAEPFQQVVAAQPPPSHRDFPKNASFTTAQPYTVVTQKSSNSANKFTRTVRNSSDSATARTIVVKALPEVLSRHERRGHLEQRFQLSRRKRVLTWTSRFLPHFEAQSIAVESNCFATAPRGESRRMFTPWVPDHRPLRGWSMSPSRGIRGSCALRSPSRRCMRVVVPSLQIET